MYYQELVADFLFVLCKENINRLIKYTGYGNAAGLLASRGLMGGGQPQGNGGDYSSDDEDSETEEYAMDKSQIDPMIGKHSVKQNRPGKCFKDISSPELVAATDLLAIFSVQRAL